MMRHVDTLVIGGGAAGMAAALGADAAGKSVLLIEKNEDLGGILTQCLHHGFGLGLFKEDLTGPQYAARFIKKLAASSVSVETCCSVVRLGKDQSALLSGRSWTSEVTFDRCILASGARERTMNGLLLSGSRPSGIFTAGQAQTLVNLGGYHIGRNIVILGSGDVGQIMARRLTINGCRVIAMIEKEARPGGLLKNREECLKAFHIPLILRSTITGIHGHGRISGVTVRHLDTGSTHRIDCDTLITSIGLIPDQDLADPVRAGGQLPGWLTTAGNCLRIYDRVDNLSMDAAAAGGGSKDIWRQYETAESINEST